MNNEKKYSEKKTDNNYNSKDRIGCILFIIWFIVSLFVMISSSKYSMIAFGQFLLVFGISSYKSLKVKLISLLFTLFGVVIIVVSILYLLKVNFEWEILISLLLFVAAIITGLILIFTEILIINRLKKVCIVSVDATIIKYSFVYENIGYGRNKVYSPIYAFNYDNKYYETVFPYYNNFSKLNRVNCVEKIKINPNNPYEILVFSNSTQKYMIILYSFITFLFIIALIYYCVFVI